MDRLDFFRQSIRHLLTEYAKLVTQNDGIEAQTIFDTEHDHYLLVHVGWRGNFQQIYGPAMHFDIKDGKVWVQYDSTDFDPVGELLEMGLKQDEIVLGFHAPYKRKHTGFAIA